ncbi:molybdopterin oxidoreductase [Slackia equolifaciens]|uniref:Molybdopterin oxidoreductase n=1 Tax=Slackia equolifaciens TaxID=498718 RepID=A0A3N0B1D6_9ACTN|nr:molybdopterin-dependent oxidoreductase [Slackia equolifaciens]RNL40579.1 molybdopterin oxidoreductase [Slackia equolifaciens]
MGESTSRGFTRRNFIKGAALLTATGALAGCAPQTEGMQEATTEVKPDEIYCGSCRGACMQGCQLNVHVRDGRVVRTSARELPDSRYTRICSKGLTQPFRMYSSERLQYPMKRVGERGEGKFERISWDEAIQTITDNWKKNIEEFGPASNVKCTNGGNLGAPTFVWSTLAAILGMTSVGTDFDAAWSTAGTPMLGGPDMFRAQNENADLLNSKTIVAWGFNPVISHVQTMHFINEARENGTKFIVIDPVFSPTAQFADWFIPINAGTDAALAMSVLNVVVENGWHNEEFLKAHTEAPFLIKEDGTFLRMSDLGVEPTEGDPNPLTGEPTIIDPNVVWDEDAQQAVAYAEAKNPKLSKIPQVEGFTVKTEWEVIVERIAEYGPDAASEITGVPADDIRELARVYGEEGPVNTYNIYGFNHYFNAHQAYRAVNTLGFALGYIGVQGGATGSGNGEPYGLYNVVGVSMPKDADGNYCQGTSPLSPPVSEFNEIFDTGEYQGQPFPLKSIVFAVINPLGTNTGREYMLEWINKFELVVVADMVMSETAKYADILLPVAYWFEVEDALWQSTNSPFVLWQDKVCDPLYESKSDREMVKMLVDAMGYSNFPLLESDDAYQQAIFDTDALRQSGITLDKLKQEKALRHWTADGSEFIAYKNYTFGTSSGLISLYQEEPYVAYVPNSGSNVDAERERSVAWTPPKEAWINSEARKTFPFHCISERPRTRTHTQWQDVGYLNELYPEPVCKINPEDASELGIVEGDTVRLFNDRGSVVMRAVLHAGAPRKTVTVPRGFEMDEFIEGHFGNLSMHEYDGISRNQVFLDCAIDIEKIEEGE